jgi:transposase InsO family protein
MFTLLHCDVWTSPAVSNSGFKYYLVILDDFTHYVWTFPLQHKSDILATFVSFNAFVQTQFHCSISCLQTDNGKEFDNHALRSFLAAHGMVLRLTCPYMS